MKFALIIPTYNDANTIIATLESVLAQSHQDYSVAIVDDGSTDETAAMVKQFLKDHKLKTSTWHYLHQENADQLNAVIRGANAVTGDYYFILHSDDFLPDEQFFARADQYISAHPGHQAYTGDLTIINGSGEVTGAQHYHNYYSEAPAKLLTRVQLCLGRNQCVDFGFFSARFFREKMTESYLLWNTPFWLDPSGSAIYDVDKMPFPILHYRIHDHNYDSSYKGQLNVINGELRTAAIIAANFSIPFFNTQRFLYRLFNKLGLIYYPFYLSKPQVNKAAYFHRIVKARFSSSYTYDPFLRSLVRFYEHYRTRTVKLKFKKAFEPFYGKDNNAFNCLNLLGQLPPEYVNFLSEMEQGFNRIVVSNRTDLRKAEALCKFFCIHPDVKIDIRE